MQKIKILCVLVGVCVTIFSCSEQEKKELVSQKQNASLLLPSPFKKHLKIEVGPDRIFDVFSWGRGSDSSSSVLVLRSDSLKNEFTVASTDNLDGHLKEIFNTDMDKDSNPEIIIYYTKNDKYQTADVLCYEFNGKNVNKITFPDLTSSTQKQYRGNDKFYVKGGELYREFNLYANSDSASKPTDKKVLKYFLKRNRFDLNEIKE